MSLFLGIDTSAYTTSMALVDENHTLVADMRFLLKVGQGKRGLRQSEALFQHVKNLPLVLQELQPYLRDEVAAIAASAFPCSTPGSYMPVFLAGLSQARSLSAFAGIPLFEVSHQEGHIMAGIYDNPELLQADSFLAIHFSGGTSELMRVKKGHNPFFHITTCLGGTDLHAGQLVDRVGVALGLLFPAGRSLEELALKADEADIPLIPAAVNHSGFSFSGAETRALSFIEQGYPPEQIALAIFRMIANTLEKIILNEYEQSGIKEVLLVGGVMANSLIRERLHKRLEHPAVGLKLYFANPALSTDNAAGTALLASYLAEQG